jgi:hypothetical protein
MKKLVTALFFLVLFCSASVFAQGSDVPKEYKDLYSSLEKKLNEIELRLVTDKPDVNVPIYSVDLLAANGHRGKVLFEDKTFKGCVFILKRLKELGVKAITIPIEYPYLSKYYKNYSKYFAFYKKITDEVKSQGFKLIIKNGVIFPDLDTEESVDFKNISFEKICEGYREITNLIIKEFMPDYLSIINEPGTIKRNTGIEITEERYQRLIDFVLDSLDKRGVKVGAGAGNWDAAGYFKAASKHPSIDYVDLHLYPINRNLGTEKLIEINQIADEFKKPLAISESWLYKIEDNELSSITGSETKVLKRDAYSFWAPLDQKYLSIFTKYARKINMQYCSFFWMTYLYGYVEYNKKTKNLDYKEITLLVNTSTVTDNLISGNLSSTGKVFKELIK